MVPGYIVLPLCRATNFGLAQFSKHFEILKNQSESCPGCDLAALSHIIIIRRRHDCSANIP